MKNKLTKEQQKIVYSMYERMKEDSEKYTKEERMRRRIEMLNNSFDKDMQCL